MPKASELQEYSELLERYEKEKNVPYVELLKTEEWFEKRSKIIERDNRRCTKCGRKATIFTPETGHIERIPVPIRDPLGNILDGEVAHYITRPAEDPCTLHVHHKYYVLEQTPWEYADEALLTLCSNCHEELHNDQSVPVYETRAKLNEMSLTPCGRCGGKGRIPKYDHVQDGICFRCHGARFDERI